MDEKSSDPRNSLETRFPLSQPISLLLIALGVALLFLGVRAYDSNSSDFARFFTDHPTDKAIWTLIAGSVALIAGIVGLKNGRSRSA